MRAALAFAPECAILKLENKNAAACGCANTRKPAQVTQPPTQRPRAAPHGILYEISSLFTRVGFVVIPKSASGFVRFHRCVGVYPAQRFCFHPVPGVSPPACGEEKTKTEKKGTILLKKIIALLCTLLLLASLTACSSHVCDFCGKTFSGKAYTRTGDIILCKDCAQARDAFYSWID